MLDGYNGNNGLGHVGSFMATVPANSRTATMSEASGVVMTGSMVVGADGWLSGTGVRTNESGNPTGAMILYQTTALSGIATTFGWMAIFRS